MGMMEGVWSFVVEVGKALRQIPSSEFGTASELASVASVVGALWYTTPQHSTSDNSHSYQYSFLSSANNAHLETRTSRAFKVH
jgi:hypothetical protein